MTLHFLCPSMMDAGWNSTQHHCLRGDLFCTEGQWYKKGSHGIFSSCEFSLHAMLAPQLLVTCYVGSGTLYHMTWWGWGIFIAGRVVQGVNRRINRWVNAWKKNSSALPIELCDDGQGGTPQHRDCKQWLALQSKNVYDVCLWARNSESS